ncbi:MAG: hypothetical protein H6737_23430 [Alphaproteobacteria bacterium]|nr:hypothetical protein [Alphaproteobacteria bacterium]
MRTVLALSLATACAPAPEVAGTSPGRALEGPDADAAIEAFVESGAAFGALVDPSTGEVVPLESLDRAVVNSGDFSQAGISCLDCGGVNATCTGPSGSTRTLRVDLVRNSGNGPVDVVGAGGANWVPISRTCDGGTCPADVDATGGPVAFQLDMLGVLPTCSAFAVWFDTVEPVTTTAQFLDGASADSIFEVGATQALPAQGWVALLSSSAQIFDLGGLNGALVGGTPYGNYDVQYVTGTPIEPDSTYQLDADLGFVAGLPGGQALLYIELGTSDGFTFSSLSDAATTAVYAGNLSAGVVSGHLTTTFSTGGSVTGDPLAVRLGQGSSLGSGTSDFAGFDNVVLRVTN